MKLLSILGRHWKESYLFILLALGICTVFIKIVLFLYYHHNIPMGHLSRDLSVIANLPAHAGFLSQIGIFFWSGTTGICLLSYKVVSNFPRTDPIKRFFLISAIFTLILGIDDAFVLHEDIFPAIGIPEKLVLLSYALFLSFYLVKFFRVILQTEYLLLVTPLFFFGLSIFIDLLSRLRPDFLGIHDDIRLLLEDGTKLVGIVSWFIYFLHCGEQLILRYLRKYDF
ncbi:hypothetical protein JJD41_10120 [Oxynema sp. CENA135]|uniref:hypothetical protein n=1 Tax=Oxynema sp. CENA135 TaxID=984206 RepID=UPI00190E0B9C|nr:hypothetical protein [Oxynema sp. CENA135]MBK4730213.1 hypothetical protein [Oxynema sp. CENA135]